MTPQTSGTEALLQAISIVDEQVVWVSGHAATYGLTTDGGATWTTGTVPGAIDLQFRDVAAFDARTAYLMSAGTGQQSRIYRTDDGGATWSLQHTAADPAAFFDCMDFWSADRGLVYGDAVDGFPFLLTTQDGGRTWTRVPSAALPPAQEGEGGFAASGTCVRVGDDGRAWVAMGNGTRARMLRTTDYGATWGAVDVPVVGGSAAGLTSLDISPEGPGVAVGGVIGNDTLRSNNVAMTPDAGTSWMPAGALAMTGPAYGSALVPGWPGFAVAVGPRGLDVSTDWGHSWRSADTSAYWAVAFASPDAGWAVGPAGRIMRLSFGS